MPHEEKSSQAAKILTRSLTMVSLAPNQPFHAHIATDHGLAYVAHDVANVARKRQFFQ